MVINSADSIQLVDTFWIFIVHQRNWQLNWMAANMTFWFKNILTIREQKIY